MAEIKHPRDPRRPGSIFRTSKGAPAHSKVIGILITANRRRESARFAASHHQTLIR